VMASQVCMTASTRPVPRSFSRRRAGRNRLAAARV